MPQNTGFNADLLDYCRNLSPLTGARMSKREDQRIAALVKKNTAKVANPKVDRSSQYDDTLKTKAAEQEEDTKKFFKEMKRREF